MRVSKLGMTPRLTAPVVRHVSMSLIRPVRVAFVNVVSSVRDAILLVSISDGPHQILPPLDYAYS
jgi:hypothetical protein